MKTVRDQTASARLLFAITALFWCAQYSYTPFINPELAKMGMNAAFMGLVSGAYGLTQTLLRIPLGMAADRIGRQKPFVVAGCLLSSLATGLLLVRYSSTGFLLARGLAGAASASWVSFTVLYGSYYPLVEGPRRISHLNIGNMGGRLLGYLLVLFVIPLVGISFSFSFSVVASLLALVASFGLFEQGHGRQGINLRELAKVSTDRYLRVCALLGIFTQVIAFSTYYGFVVNAAKDLGADDTMLIWLSICLLVPTLALNFLLTSGKFRHFNARALVTLGFLLSALYCFLVPQCAKMWQLLLCQGLAGLASTLTFAVLLGQCVRDIKGSRRAVAMGLYQAVYGIGMTLGPIATGLVLDVLGLGFAFYMVAMFSLVSAYFSWRLMRPAPQVQAT